MKSLNRRQTAKMFLKNRRHFYFLPNSFYQSFPSFSSSLFLPRPASCPFLVLISFRFFLVLLSVYFSIIILVYSLGILSVPNFVSYLFLLPRILPCLFLSWFLPLISFFLFLLPFHVYPYENDVKSGIKEVVKASGNIVKLFWKLIQNIWIRKYGYAVNSQLILMISAMKIFLKMISLIWGVKKYCELNLMQRVKASFAVFWDKLTSSLSNELCASWFHFATTYLCESASWF